MNQSEKRQWADRLSATQFTRIAERKVNLIVDAEACSDLTEKELYQYLLKITRDPVPFHMQLKRYIHHYLRTDREPDEIEMEEWIELIDSSFNEHSAPHPAIGWRATMKRWLTAETVSRDTVFMLGFGLGMDRENVSIFLQSYISEEDFRPCSTDECIYQYCFAHHYPYSQVKVLKDCVNHPSEVTTPHYIENIDGTETEEMLINHLLFLRETGMESKWEEAARNHFSALLEDCKQVVLRLRQEADQADFIATGEKRHEPVQQMTPDSISAYDIENVLYTGITRTTSGNLEKASKSALHKMISGNRLSRQRIDGILKKELNPNRFDLITLAFLKHAQDGCWLDGEPMEAGNVADDQERFHHFYTETNDVLKDCGMGMIYPVHPYEAFILMAIQSTLPLSFFNDIWGNSYDNNGSFDNEE